MITAVIVELTSFMDQVGSDILWTDVNSQHCQGPNPSFSSRDQPIWYTSLGPLCLPACCMASTQCLTSCSESSASVVQTYWLFAEVSIPAFMTVPISVQHVYPQSHAVLLAKHVSGQAAHE